MFLPTSPRPPRGMMRRLTRRSVCAVLDGGRLEQPEPREAVAHAVVLVLARLDEGQPVAADLVAELVQGRLDRDRVADHAEQLDRRLDLAVERPCRVGLASPPEPDQLLHLRSDDVGMHADSADAAEL